tara:strand:+ start:539 stop:829 length:291 start_codon:yes stop_codon:yes gene_type:complete
MSSEVVSEGHYDILLGEAFAPLDKLRVVLVKLCSGIEYSRFSRMRDFAERSPPESKTDLRRVIIRNLFFMEQNPEADYCRERAAYMLHSLDIYRGV